MGFLSFSSHDREAKSQVVVSPLSSSSDEGDGLAMVQMTAHDYSDYLTRDRKRPAEHVLTSIALMPRDAALAYVHADPTGLSVEEASARLSITGPNLLSTAKPLTWWQLLLRVIPNAFNILLGVLAIISIASPQQQWSTFVILIIMIVISVLVRFWQEYKSNTAAVKLQESVSNTVVARRSVHGKAADIDIDERQLVPGDILSLSPGDNVPADCLVLDSTNLQLSQSSMTGESEPVSKRASPSGEKADAGLFDLGNICFMGTSVISGSGTLLVIRTGDDAFLATIMKQLNKKRPLNAFQKGTRNVSYMLLGFMGILVPLVLVVSAKTTGSWIDAAYFTLSVAVGLVPEMLPAIVDGNLARGAFVLAKKEAIVKRLDAIQNLGGMSILCSDKTGTLTKDEISLCHVVDPAGNRSDQVLKLAYINAANQSGKKNNIDFAILKYIDDHKVHLGGSLGEKVAEIPFNFEKRRSSCIVRTPTGILLLICKGAFEEVMSLCKWIRKDGQDVPITPEMLQDVQKQVNAYNNDGFRAIAIATKQVTRDEMDDSDAIDDLDTRMTLHGLMTFLDPPKDDAKESIKQLQDLNVDVRVLTGDNLGVALKICRTLELVREVDEEQVQAVTGPQLAKMEPDEFDNVVKTCKVFAKLTPNQKGDVITSLRKAGNTIGMLGDGINDCVALRLADAGISVDTGATAAKSCADVILTRKELKIIVDCVTIGRLTHGNTIKYIKMVLSSNFGNVFSVLIGSAWLPYNPMTGLQILIQNLLYDVSQIAIPWDRMDEEYLTTPKRWDAKDLLRFVVILGPLSSTIDMCTFSLDWFYYGIRDANSPLVPRAQAHWFLEGLLTQTLIVHLLRTAKVPVFQSRAAHPLVFSTVAIILVGFAIPFIPQFDNVLAFARPATSFIGFLAAELLLYCVEVQLFKMIYIRLFKVWL